MDPVSLCFSVCVMMVCLPGAARFSSSTNPKISTTQSAATKNNTCPCPEIPHMRLTKSPPQTCFQIGDKFRYKCIDGYLRKAGTSDRTICNVNEGIPQWTKPTLYCKRDPSTHEMQSLTTLPSVSRETVTTETTTCESIKATTVAAVATVFLITACSLGIVFLLYRRSKENIGVLTADGVKPINPDLCGVDAKRLGSIATCGFL